MKEKDFFDRFTKLLENIKDMYDLENIHDALIIWFGENYLSIDPYEVKDRIVKDNHAEGIDAILIDEMNYKLHFIQARTVASFENTRKNYPENDLKSTSEGFRFLVKGDYKGQITPELENLVDEYHALDKKGVYTTSVVFLNLMQPPHDMKFIDNLMKDFPEIEVSTFGFNKLLDYYKNEYLVRTAKPPEKISFKILTNSLRKDAPHKALLFTSKGEEIARIYNEHKEKIFQQNVRYSLGMRTKSINKQILETATLDNVSDSFWYFNNGITIVCDEMKLSTSETVINLKNAQVINGAQTTYALYEAYQNGMLKDNVEVPIKVIETDNKKFIENVTLFTNSQNAIRLRDLLSNLQIQVAIQKILFGSYKYFYERKRGELDSLYPTLVSKEKLLGGDYKKKLISNENAAQAFLALYISKPAQAKSEKAKIFLRDGGFYDEIFNPQDKILAEKLLLSWKLFKYIETQKKEYNKDYYGAVRLVESKKAEDLTEEDKEKIVKIYKYNFLHHGEYFILNLFKDFLLNQGFDIDNNKDKVLDIISRIDSNDALIKTVYMTIKDEFANYIKEIQKTPGYYHNKFFKNEKSIGLIRNHFNENFSFVEII